MINIYFTPKLPNIEKWNKSSINVIGNPIYSIDVWYQFKKWGGMSEIAYILNRVFEFAIFTCKFVYSWPFKVFLFCCRETGLAGESGDLLEQRKLLSVVKKNIEALCRKVNQVNYLWFMTLYTLLKFFFRLWENYISHKSTQLVHVILT